MVDTDPYTHSDGDRFDEIERLLQTYPDVTEDELQVMTRWFNKEASAFEVASLASKESVKDGYAKFRSDHIDRFSAREVVLGTLSVAVAILVVVAIGFLAS